MQEEEEGEHERRVSGQEKGKGHACRKRRRKSMREEFSGREKGNGHICRKRRRESMREE